ncbi:L-lactate dehydrogenase (cytochrome) [Pigmentiphaga litoralis]|uniref:L-lactate dehydrogenase (Cytochrome) n=1 Tax=Pigmentiphaga litoralis TaxID=516702 RepID=A0A7Y9LK92_9BURK|nr:alpha-hydroxy acid oxidase [Pigmentiphaga litoralis]NYE25084.1 L-lactate dehydrogenase (cytochrome) [Pigmentiphaga litoralis]NYE81302.1 L-lactate dehydrogenase (cytochrome) [Pigmentiphaga litoralis]
MKDSATMSPSLPATQRSTSAGTPPRPRSTQVSAAAPVAPTSSVSRPPRALRKVFALDDFEAAARRHLPRPVFGYMCSYAETGAAFDANRDAYADYGFMPQVMVDVSKRSTQTELFGETYAAPFGFAPVGLTALSTYRGDLVLARAALESRLPMIMSGSSLIPLEEVAALHPGAWFQAYLPGDRGAIELLIDRVARTAFKTLVITVDTPVPPNSENTARMGFSAPLRPSIGLAWQGMTHPRWLLGTFLRTLARHGMPHFENNYATRGAPILSPSVLRDFSERGHLAWDDLRTIRKQWRGRLIVKGILRADDARMARDCGADGIIVSNHGGRQLDGAIAPLRALPAVVAACPDIPVMIDSGVRRGTDVLKALALGAKLAFVGRPFGYAAAVGGVPGVQHGVKLLTAEVSRNMAMLGVNSVTELQADRHLVRMPGRG